VDYEVSRMERGRDGYFTVRWSPFSRAEKYDIATKVPSIGGIAELYYMDRAGKLNLFCLQRSWYGGLRSMLRERCDPVLEKDPFRLSILVKWRERIYYRWTACESMADMLDLVFFLSEVNGAGGKVIDSGRYERIFVDELDTGKLTTS
jgi:hypothetical protein